jgi:hypothetical protein
MNIPFLPSKSTWIDFNFQYCASFTIVFVAATLLVLMSVTYGAK